MNNIEINNGIKDLDKYNLKDYEDEIKKYKKRLRESKKYGIPYSYNKELSDSQKFMMLEYNSDKKFLDVSLVDNKLFEMDKKTEKSNKIINYIESKFDSKIYKKEKNSAIFYNKENQIVYDFAVVEKNGAFENDDDKIFSYPDFICAIVTSDKAREMFLNTLNIYQKSNFETLIIDLKTNVIMKFKHTDNWRYNDKYECKIINKSTGKFICAGIEFDSKKIL